MEPDEADDLLADVADRADLREGEEGVRRLLLALFRRPGAGARPLARAVGLPIPVTVAVLGELEKEGLVRRGTDKGEGLHLADRGEAVATALGFRHRDVPAPYPAEVPEAYRDLLGELETIAAGRGAADTTRDQAYATPETALRRALTLLSVGGLEGRSVLFVGDSDLVSAACALVGGAEELAVVDVDARLADLLPDGIIFREADLREGLPDAYHGRFDAAVTDPPYTLAGAQLFLARAVEGLATEAVGAAEATGDPEATDAGEGPRPAVRPGLPILVSYARVDADVAHRLQRRIGGLGLAVRALVPAFNRYHGAHLLGGRGDLYHLETTSRTRALPLGEAGGGEAAAADAPIYTGQARPTLRRYVCTDCGEAVLVGQGQAHATIEALQEAGCPGCGGTSLRLEGRVGDGGEEE